MVGASVRRCFLLLLPSAVLACTTLVVGKKATADGSVLCSHSNDGAGATDPRLVYIPPADHAANAMRPVFFATEEYPRYVGTARGDIPAYAPTGNQSASKPIGEIPQIPHTFGYYEQTYGAINEHQVGIGESTCSGVFGTKAVGHGGKALLSVDTLSQLAMERATSARQAVQVMGSLAEQYGFYGEGSFEGSAESLMVTDADEGWIFHILPDPTGTTAIWAAARVPDDEVGVVANVFVIRELNVSDGSNFLASQSTFDVAKAKGWWDPSEGLLDFTATYSDGEYAHKYYSGRRVWGAYNLLAPSKGFPAEYGEWRRSKPYPVSVRPDKKITVADVAAVMRSVYEGTKYDMTAGLAAGPFGTPDHVAGGSAGGKVKGNWERTIGLYRTSDSHIVQSRGWLPNATGGTLWWGAHSAEYTTYVPFTMAMGGLPPSTLGYQATLAKETLFWATRYLANYAQLRYKPMIAEIRAMQAEAHADGLATQARVDSAAAAAAARGVGGDPSVARREYLANAERALSRMWATADGLMFKYADGYVSTVAPDGSFSSAAINYPDWWLTAVNYSGGPPPVPNATL